MRTSKVGFFLVFITLTGVLMINETASAEYYKVITEASHPAYGNMIVADNGVPFYSIVNHNAGILEVHTEPGGGGWSYDSLELTGSVTIAHFLLYSAFSLNVSTGVSVATLTIYYEDGDSKSLDLIEGVNIAEWAYDRPEAQPYLMHDKVPPIYSWLTHLDSEYWYEGHLFYASMDLELRPLDRIELVLNHQPDEWFAARIAGITLSGKVSIDIKPGDYPNTINIKSEGNVPVAILSELDFDATTVDPSTVIFAGASALRIGGGPEDVNGDGLMDIVLHFKTQDLDLQPGDTEAFLGGKTFDGLEFAGCDSVRIIE